MLFALAAYQTENPVQDGAAWLLSQTLIVASISPKIFSRHHPISGSLASSVYQFFKPAVNILYYYSNFASRAFSVSVPSVWNSLKPDLRSVRCIEVR